MRTQRNQAQMKEQNKTSEKELNEMKNNLQGINSRIDEAKHHISDLQYKEAKTTNQNSKKKKESKKK